MKALILTLRCLLGLVLGALIVCCGWLLVSDTFLGQDPPQLLGYAPLAVEGAEMEPALAEGDLAILRMGQECQPGDIVAFRNEEDKLVLRRIVGTSEGQFVTQQEAFGQPDMNLLDPAEVEASCVTYLPGCGQAVVFLYSPLGLAILAAVAAVLLLVPAFLIRGSREREAVDIFDEYAAPRPSKGPQPSRDVFEEYAAPRRSAPRYTGSNMGYNRPAASSRPAPREVSEQDSAYPLDSASQSYSDEADAAGEDRPANPRPARPSARGRYQARH